MKVTPPVESTIDEESPRRNGDRPAGLNSQQPLPDTWSGVAVALVGSALILLAMSLPPLCGVRYRFGDLGAFHYPLRVFYAECLSQGHRFEWMPSLFAGFFVAGEGQLGVYHPVHLLLYRALPVRAAFALELLVNYPFMLAGTYLLMRRIVDRRDSAAFAAMVFTFGSFTMLHFGHPNAVAIIAHIPWLLFVIHVAAHGSGWRQLVAEASIPLLTVSQLLLGYPQYVWMSLLAECAWAMYVFRTDWRLYVRLAGMNLIGLLLGAIQLLPTWDCLQHSERSKATLAFLMEGSWLPTNLLQVFAPYLLKGRTFGGNTGEYGLYFGAVPLFLVYWLLYRHRLQGKRRELARCVGAFLLFAMILAFGRFGGLAMLQTYLPVVGTFRVPARALVLVNLAAAILAGIGFEEIRQVKDRQRRTDVAELGRRLTIFSLVVLTALSLAVGLRYGTQYLSAWPGLLAGPALVAAGSVMCHGLGQGRAWAVPAVVLFTAGDLGYYGFSYEMLPAVASSVESSEVVPPPPGRPGDRIIADPTTFGAGAGRYMGDFFIEAGFTHVDGYAGLEPQTRLFSEPPSVSALRAAAVRWVCGSATSEPPKGLTRVNEMWWMVPDPLPRIRLATRAIETSRPSHDIKDIDVETTVLVERPLVLAGGAVGHATLAHEEPGRMTIQTDALSEQILVVSDRYHSGWSAEIDGSRVPVLRVNGDFMGCVVPTGRHTAVWTFQPLSLLWGARITMVGAFLWTLYIALHARSLTKQRASANSGSREEA